MLAAHFALGEFLSRDGVCPPDALIPNVRRLAAELETIRRAIQRPILIVSGYRSPAHNTRVRGAKSSRHMTGEAADIRIAGVEPGEILALVERLIRRGRLHNGGVGLYRTWVHYDVRAQPARWRG